MKSYIGSVLDRGAWQAYEAWLLGRLSELMDRIREGFGGYADKTLQAAGVQFERIDPTQLLTDGTAFFWMNAHRLYRMRGPDIQPQLIQNFLITGFDCYFHRIPDGAFLVLPEAECRTVILPRLGIAVPNFTQGVLRRISSHILEIEAADWELTIDLNIPPGNRRARTFRITEESGRSVIAIAEAALTSRDTAAAVSERDIREFSERIRCGLQLIDSIDSELCRSIRRLIHWCVPLKMSSPDRHLSLSERDLIGVIHLSEGYSGMRLVEAIIHEFHHNELFVMETSHQLAPQDSRAVFYSPWRSDPRPLSSLLHALHVFSAVVKFYRMAEVADVAGVHRSAARERRSNLCRMLRIARLQVPEEALSPLGKNFLRDVETGLESQESELQLKSAPASNEILSHARAWCKANPDCVQHLRWPGSVRDVVN